MATIGTLTSGKPAVACEHWAVTWPLVVQLWALLYPAAHPLEIIQALGSATKSAGTHGKPGTALDLRTWRYVWAVIHGLLVILRSAGADASWYRTKAQGFDPHIHAVLDCPCTSPADYQLVAVRAGFNGLGPSGRGGRDDGPPITRRNWSQGVAWLRSEIARLTPTSGGLTMSDIQTLLAKLDYQQAQLRAIGDMVGGRDAINRRNADVATIVKAATDAQSRVLIDAFGKLGVATVDMNALKTEVRKAVADALDGATLEIQARQD